MKSNDKRTIEDNFYKILEIPQRASTLEEYEKAEILSFIRTEKSQLRNEATEFAVYNPEYPYPENINSFDEKVNYWQSTISRGLFDLRRANFVENLLRPKPVGKNNRTPSINLTFEKLFRKEELAQDVKIILETHGYTKNNNWVDTGNKNIIGAAFFALKEREHDFCIIKTGKPTPQLKTFCKEFGIIAYSENEPIGDVSIKNLLAAKNISAIDEFKRIFSPLKKK
jgi:hypothetical protein